ncbi:Uncharacterised protein [Mycobacteroides abscessus subsp. abscessus]|nr:Uncharacterised protein [Mycobacteroides abscessus subsp. abscessus]
MLDGQPEVGHPLHLVDEHESGSVQEGDGIVRGGIPGAGIVQVAFDDIRVVLDAVFRQRALTGLAGAVDDHHAGIFESLFYQFSRMPR